jgi:hypothetical protein
MLGFLNHKNPDLKLYESLPGHLKYEFTKQIANHYKPEKNHENLKSLDESLKYPLLFKYWNNSLD